MQSVDLLKITVDDILANSNTKCSVRLIRVFYTIYLLDPSLVVGILGETYLRFLSIYDKKNIYLIFSNDLDFGIF